MISATTEKVIKQFKKADLSLADRSALLSVILDKLKAVPLNDSIVVGNGTVAINGKQLDTEQIINFKESAIALRDNTARKVLHEEVRYLATNMGVYKSVTLDELVFAKAALWCLNQEDELLAKFV